MTSFSGSTPVALDQARIARRGVGKRGSGHRERARPQPCAGEGLSRAVSKSNSFNCLARVSLRVPSMSRRGRRIARPEDHPRCRSAPAAPPSGEAAGGATGCRGHQIVAMAASSFPSRSCRAAKPPVDGRHQFGRRGYRRRSPAPAAGSAAPAPPPPGCWPRRAGCEPGGRRRSGSPVCRCWLSRTMSRSCSLAK